MYCFKNQKKKKTENWANQIKYDNDNEGNDNDVILDKKKKKKQ